MGPIYHGNLHDIVPNLSWVGSVLDRSCTASPVTAGYDLDGLDDVQILSISPTCVMCWHVPFDSFDPLDCVVQVLVVVCIGPPNRLIHLIDLSIYNADWSTTSNGWTGSISRRSSSVNSVEWGTDRIDWSTSLIGPLH